MRPWEFWEADSAELYMLRSLKSAYYEGRQDAREQIDAAAQAKSAGIQQ